MYKYIFGPVPSRRLGMSLGVDLVPRKVCSLDCVYCEVGETNLLTTERDEYIPFDSIKEELTDYFAGGNPEPEYITFSGSGEPTLNNRIGDIIEVIRQHKPGIPIAVLTNGTLLGNKEVRESLLATDIVLPSLDAVTDDVFKKINRPEKSLNVSEHIKSLIDFRNEYNGKIYLEVFILPGFNNSDEHIHKLREALIKIHPDRIQVNTLDRPGTINSIRAASEDELKAIVTKIGLNNLEIISKVQSRKSNIAYRADAETAILQTILRRPCTLDDLSFILGLHINEINKYLDVLEKDDKIEVVKEERGYFYRVK